MQDLDARPEPLPVSLPPAHLVNVSSSVKTFYYFVREFTPSLFAPRIGPDADSFELSSEAEDIERAGHGLRDNDT